ncbi:hypothetical protein PORY_000749 [Pneumocystis oryctolagi]|uniref:Uncharacterized protein n=1 Tax=Pneumocystis oryctolagi TaxID=42067 RepID=A0ACB7CIV3_9ASCO|nr:hypothetical protein PORY_000749 [Pneumocystis oryctolagi]
MSNITGNISRKSENIPSDRLYDSLYETSSINTENSYQKSRNKLFEMVSPKYDQNVYTNGYDSNYNNEYKKSNYENYAPRDDDDYGDDVEAIKQEMRFIKQDSLSSTQNAVRAAVRAEQIGRHTLESLGAQSEKIGTTEKYLDLTTVNVKMAEEKNKSLKLLNRSVFIPHFRKPWKKQARLLEKEQRIRDQYELEQLEREQTRKSEHESLVRIKDALNKQRDDTFGNKTSNSRLQYRFEPDEEDDEIEDEIDQNLTQLGNITAQLKAIATATQEEIISQNARLDRISEKGHKLNSEIHINAERLKRIN